MRNKYRKNATIFKALGDKNRLMIIDMLSCGELCACEILEKFNITQPTLSHHMQTLCDCGLVVGRKDGKWTYYSLDAAKIQEMKDFIGSVTTSNKDCICRTGSKEEFDG